MNKRRTLTQRSYLFTLVMYFSKGTKIFSQPLKVLCSVLPNLLTRRFKAEPWCRNPERERESWRCRLSSELAPLPEPLSTKWMGITRRENRTPILKTCDLNINMPSRGETSILLFPPRLPDSVKTRSQDFLRTLGTFSWADMMGSYERWF